MFPAQLQLVPNQPKGGLSTRGDAHRRDDGMGRQLRSSVSPLLKMTAEDLLAQFGAGAAVPGSGSAAALNGAIACALVTTSAKLTIGRVKESLRRDESEYILARVGERRPKLQQLVQQDSEAFQKVIAQRRLRDAARTPSVRKKCSDRERTLLRKCTDLALEIAIECLAVAQLGLAMVRIGYKPARGDPAVGASNALAGALGAICVVLVNLQKRRGGQQARKQYASASNLFQRFREVEHELVEAVAGLRDAKKHALDTQLMFAL